MAATAIRTHGLGKLYRIGIRRHPYTTLRDLAPRAVAASVRGVARLLKGEPLGFRRADTFWALRDVTFEVKHGEVIGIIGRNGAGKSTLLKLLSRITRPTSGWAEITGRVGLLLEVGTGFHPELTGRENIYLSGAVLGMKRLEIHRNFDQIVAFAEIEKFLDTPVKHYSSGMYVRLAFAVAAHLEPEVLIVDEVLAVGDAAFQKKCLGKMSEVATEGRTVLFVSHNLQAVAALCNRVMWLDGGTVQADGAPRETIGQYVLSAVEAPLGEARIGRPGGDRITIDGVHVLNAEGRPCAAIDCFQPFDVEIVVSHGKLTRPVRLVLELRSAADGLAVLNTNDWDAGAALLGTEGGVKVVRCELPANLLNSGTYLISVSVDEPGRPVLLSLDNAMSFAVVCETAPGPGPLGQRSGVISPFQRWRLVASDTAGETAGGRRFPSA